MIHFWIWYVGVCIWRRYNKIGILFYHSFLQLISIIFCVQLIFNKFTNSWFSWVFLLFKITKILCVTHFNNISIASCISLRFSHCAWIHRGFKRCIIGIRLHIILSCYFRFTLILKNFFYFLESWTRVCSFFLSLFLFTSFSFNNPPSLCIKGNLFRFLCFSKT